MISVTLANKSLLVVLVTSSISISTMVGDVDELNEFGSLAKINESAGKKILNLKDVYGKNINIFQGAEKLEAVKLGEFVGGKKNEDYFGYDTVGKTVSIKPEELKILFNDKHIAPFASGKVIPVFALVFHGSEKKSTLLVSAPDKRIGINSWVLMEVDSGLLVAVDREASKCLISVAKSLGLSD
jgi:hypothetical protein